MTWTVTARGVDVVSAGAGDLSSDTFTPAAECLLLACFVHNGADGAVNGISGHGTWAQIFIEENMWANNREIELWACLTGASPSSSALTVDIDYINKGLVQFVEIDETAGFDVTLANNFGTHAFDTQDHPNSSPTTTIATVASFAASTNMAFGIVATGASSTDHLTAGSGFTELNEYNDGVATGYTIQTIYQASEDTTIDSTAGISSLSFGLAGIEIKHAAGAGGGAGPRGTPLGHPIKGALGGPV